MQTFDTQSEFDAAGMIAYLTAHGYRVSKARAAKRAYSEVGYDVRRCVHCGGESAVVTRVGARKPKDRLGVGLCVDCYRFGPHLHAVPRVPANRARYARLYRVWRRAHHRYARRIAAVAAWESAPTPKPAYSPDALPTGRMEVVGYWSPEAGKRLEREESVMWYPVKEAFGLVEKIKKAQQAEPFVAADGTPTRGEVAA